MKKVKKYYKEDIYIHYSNCHEDANMIINNSIKNINTVLSIASGGDNSFACLLLNPSKVVCIDSNLSQVFIVTLKKTAVKYLSYEEYLTFIGINDGNSLLLYERIKKYLNEEVMSYFDSHLFLISEVKLVNCGRFEYYFNVFSKKILPLIHSKKTIDKFMNCESMDEQISFYKRKFNNFRFKLMFKLFFSKYVMKKLGRDKEYFKYNKGSLSTELKQRFELGIYNNLNKYNPYLQYVIYNKFIELPLYLKKENFEIIKANIDKLDIFNYTLEDVLNKNEKYDLMNLSDVFEYIDNNEMKRYEHKIYESLNQKGRIIFWNMQNERVFTKKFKEIDVLLENDMAFYYKNILIYEKE